MIKIILYVSIIYKCESLFLIYYECFKIKCLKFKGFKIKCFKKYQPGALRRVALQSCRSLFKIKETKLSFLYIL